MPDEGDYGQQSETGQREDAIQRATWHGPIVIRTHCADCGEPIPEKRRRTLEALARSCERCIDCQTAFEKGER